MNGEDKFRQQLKDLVDSGEFPFEEKEWDRAAVYIARQRGRARARFVLWSALAITGLAGIIAVLFNINAGTRISIAANETTKNRTIAETTASAGEQPQGAAEKKPAHAAATASANKPEGAGTAAPENTKRQPETGPIALKKTHVTTTREEPAAYDKPAVTKNQKTHPIAFGPVRTAGTIEPSNPPAEKNQAGDGTFYGNDKVQIATNETAETPVEQTPETTIAAAPEPTVSKDNKEERPSNEEPAGIAETSTLTAADRAEGIQTDNVIAATPGNGHNEAEGEKTGVAAKDSVPRSVLNPPGISLEAGIALHPGWNAGIREAAGINLYGGIHYRSMITEKLILSVGAQYIRLSGLSAYTHTSASTRFSFGEEAEVTAITPQQLHFIAAPVRLLYPVTTRDVVGLGCQFAYLLDVASEVETYTVRNSQRSGIKTYSSRGYTDGFAMFDSQLSLLYRRMLTGRLWIQADFHIGLTDIKEDGFFENPGKQRSHGVRAAIIFDLK